jgi:hypothetical protein
MPLIFDDCLIPGGIKPNKMYGECCCDFECTVTTDEALTIESLSNAWDIGLFSISGGDKIFIGGIQQTFPLALNIGDSFQIPFQICAGLVGDSDKIQFNFVYGVGSQKIGFDFDAIDLSTSASPTSFNFGDVIIGQTGTLDLQIENPTACCLNYDITTTCPETVITPSLTDLLCTGDKQSNIKVDFSPTTVGTINCEIFVSVGCQTLAINATGKGITRPEPPSGGGNPVSPKRTVVDCPTSDCRLANGQPGFAQATKNSINQISRATRPKGGAGRGTNFR